MGLDLIIDAMESDKTNDYRLYVKSVFAFIRENEFIYRNLADSPDAIFFIECQIDISSKIVYHSINAGMS